MRELRLGVDERRLLRELPHFFQSFSEALTELIQNAYRAGARSVTVVLDRDRREVIVQDDGPGAPDPADLLVAGRSGWGPQVIAPAGLGFFALLGLCERVEIESHYAPGKGWRLRLGPEAFEGAPVVCEDFHPDPLGPTGLTVRAVVGPQADLVVSPEEMRQRYPVHVTYTEVRGGEAQTRHLPPPAWPEVSLDTPVGRVGLAARSNLVGRRVRIVWEHRELSAANAWPDLREALLRLPDGEFVARALEPALLLWEVDPASGVRPKLPDRREVIQDAAYRRAVGVLAETLVKAFDADGVRRRVAALGLPAVIEDPDAVRVDLQRAAGLHPLFALRAGDLLALCGYARCAWRAWDAWWEVHEYDEGVCGVEFEERAVWAQEPLRVASPVLAESLCRQGRYAVCDPQGYPVKVRARGVRWAGGEEAQAPWVGVCDVLEVVRADTGETLGAVDLVAVPWGEACDADLDARVPEEGATAWCLWRIDPEAALRLLRRREGAGAEVLGFGVLAGFDDGWIYEWVTGDGVNRDAYARHLVQVLARALLPEREREEARYDALRDLADTLVGVRSRAGFALEQLGAIRERFGEVPELRPIERLLRRVQRQLRLDAERYAPRSTLSA